MDVYHKLVHATSWNIKIYNVEGEDVSAPNELYKPKVKYGNQTTERVARANAEAFVNKYSWNLGK